MICSSTKYNWSIQHIYNIIYLTKVHVVVVMQKYFEFEWGFYALSASKAIFRAIEVMQKHIFTHINVDADHGVEAR